MAVTSRLSETKPLNFHQIQMSKSILNHEQFQVRKKQNPKSEPTLKFHNCLHRSRNPLKYLSTAI